MWGRLVLVGGCKDERGGLLESGVFEERRLDEAGRCPVQITAIRARGYAISLRST